MMVELCTRKRQIRDKDEYNMEDTSGYEKSEVRVAWLGSKYLILVLLPDGLGFLPSLSGMVNWLTQAIL